MRRKLVRLCNGVVVGCALGSLLILLGPWIMAALWHVSHPRVYRFESYEVTVPFPFMLWQGESGTMLVRLRPILAWRLY